MKPRVLRYLRIDDQPPTPRTDLALKLPVAIDNLAEWFEFCKQLAQQRLWEYELLTVDFNFKEDRTGPWFPFWDPDSKVYDADFSKDPKLEHLEWAHSLVEEQLGPNSGLLIGAHLVSHAAYRDLPCGVGFHTYYPRFVVRDMSSAMLATQILLASGAFIPIRDLRETMSRTIDLVEKSVKQSLLLGLGEATTRFRQAFLQRAGVVEQDERPVRLWMEPTSLWTLLDIFRTAQTEEELDQKLQKFGIEFYDRNGVLASLDIRSLFLDRLISCDVSGNENVFQRLPLSEVKPPGDRQLETGVIWQFIETLATRTPAQITPVLEFFRRFKDGDETKSINEAVKRKVHRLIALIFAWLDQYAERWADTGSRSWDPFQEEFDGNFPTLTEQISSLLRIIEGSSEDGDEMSSLPAEPTQNGFEARSHFIPLSGKGRSILGLVHSNSGPGTPLYKALRYDDPDSVHLSQKRQTALRHLMAVAVKWGCVEEELNPEGNSTERYRLKQVELPQRRPLRTIQADLAQRLGFDVEADEDASTQLKRIIQHTPGFENVSVKAFLSSLEERPLPDHLKWLGWEFMDEFWRPPNVPALPYDAWPVCLSEKTEKTGETISLVEWRRRVERSHEAARQVQSLIMPSILTFREGRYEIWGCRHSVDEVGGDYYHVKQDPQGRYHIYIGDVCGHGLPAALLVQELHGLITILQEKTLSPEQLCTELDNKLYERIHGSVQQEEANFPGSYNRWATLFCAVLDPAAKRLIYANAGHPSPILARKDGSVQRLEHKLNLQSRPVGILPGGKYDSETVDLTAGDRIVFFTDGLSDNIEEKLLVQHILDNRHLSARALNEALIQKGKPARGLTDDMTIIVLSVE